MFRALKNFITKLIALTVALVACFAVYIGQVCRLDGLEGERVFYLESASSQGLRKEELSLRDFTRIKGESVRFDRTGEKTEEDLVKEITEKYGAEIRFTEEVSGTISYYCYTKNGTTLLPSTVWKLTCISRFRKRNAPSARRLFSTAFDISWKNFLAFVYKMGELRQKFTYDKRNFGGSKK